MHLLLCIRDELWTWLKSFVSLWRSPHDRINDKLVTTQYELWRHKSYEQGEKRKLHKIASSQQFAVSLYVTLIYATTYIHLIMKDSSSFLCVVTLTKPKSQTTQKCYSCHWFCENECFMMIHQKEKQKFWRCFLLMNFIRCWHKLSLFVRYWCLISEKTVRNPTKLGKKDCTLWRMSFF